MLIQSEATVQDIDEVVLWCNNNGIDGKGKTKCIYNLTDEDIDIDTIDEVLYRVLKNRRDDRFVADHVIAVPYHTDYDKTNGYYVVINITAGKNGSGDWAEDYFPQITAAVKDIKPLVSYLWVIGLWCDCADDVHDWQIGIRLKK